MPVAGCGGGLQEGKIRSDEPIAKLVSGDWLPHFGQFSRWNLIRAEGPHPVGDLKFVQTATAAAFLSLHGTTMQMMMHVTLPHGGTTPFASRKLTQSGFATHPPRVLQLALMKTF